MAEPLSRLELLRHGLQRGSELAQAAAAADELWGMQALRGRLSMLCGTGRVSLAARLVAQAQRQDGACVWVVCEGFEPFAPDLAAAGVALQGLLVVRLAEAHKLARAGDLLARSGGVDLLLVDAQQAPPQGMLRRLAGHAQRHAMAVVVLSQEVVCEVASLVVQVQPQGDDRLTLTALRDRTRPGLWQHHEQFDAAPGSP